MIQKAAVLGAGTMGSRIAGHLANAGVSVLLLDMPGSQHPNELAAAAVERLKSSKPAALFEPAIAQRVRVGNFDDNLAALRDCDWVVEAVAENLEIKRSLLAKIAPFLRRNAYVTTNTSGLPVQQIAAEMPLEFRRRWFGVHFFNPPRYMRLVEVIGTPETDQAAVSVVRDFLTEQLGKTVVNAKDTPNFIANRIGMFALLNGAKLMEELNSTVEDIDAWTGSLIGWPGTAVFRLMDLIGIDVLANMETNFTGRVQDERSDVRFPAFMSAMLQRQWLGDKAAQGFYRRKPDLAVLDWRTLDYKQPQVRQFPSIEHAKKLKNLDKRLRFLFSGAETDEALTFVRRFLTELWDYSAKRVPEISDDIASIDTAMRAGFNWEKGPFELWDAAGVGRERWYSERTKHASAPVYAIITKNAGAALVDLGDGIAQIEFRTKMNAIGDEIVSFLIETLAPGSPQADRFRAFVVGTDAANFSAGANLSQILCLIEKEDWDGLDRFITGFQRMTQAVKFCQRPVIAAPFGLCLGGGAEVVLHAHARQTHAELSMGLVEIAVGLIPGGGGCKEMALRAIDGEGTWLEVFETLTSGARSGSAVQARTMKLLHPQDGITMNRDLLTRDAKALASTIAEHPYTPPGERLNVTTPGADIRHALDLAIQSKLQTGTFTEYDAVIANKLAHVIGGGNAPGGSVTSEQRLLELEREAFLSLGREKRTADRISHMLKTGKPLRN